jgi:hypothetical protein
LADFCYACARQTDYELTPTGAEMAAPPKFTLVHLMAFTLIPATVIGGMLWVLTDVLAGCPITILGSTDSPDASRTAVAFVQECDGTDGFDTQVALLPAGGAIDADTSGFLILDGKQDLVLRFISDSEIEITLPPGVTPQRQDSPEGVAVTYR